MEKDEVDINSSSSKMYLRALKNYLDRETSESGSDYVKELLSFFVAAREISITLQINSL